MKTKKTSFKSKYGSSHSGFKTKTKNRKQQRKEQRKLKKATKAEFFNRSKNKNSEEPKNKHGNNNESDRIKKLQEFAKKEKEKIINLKKKPSNEKQSNAHKSKKRKSSFSDNEDSSSFKVVNSSAFNDRMAKLQAFVNTEVKKSKENEAAKTSKSKNKKTDNNTDNDTLTKEKVRRKALLSDCKEDNKEINRLAKLLGIRKASKKKTVHPMFEEFDMNFLLQDIDQRTLQNSDNYKDGVDTSFNLDDDINAIQRNDSKKLNSKKKKLDLSDDDDSENDENFEDDENSDYEDDNDENELDDESGDDDDEIDEDMFNNSDDESDESLESESETEKSQVKSNRKVSFSKNLEKGKEVTETSTKNESTKSILKKSKTIENDLNNSDGTDSEDEDENEDNSDDESSEDNDDGNTDNTDNSQNTREDIYGRLLDKDGNVIEESKTNESTSGSKYVPPALRKLMLLNSSDSEKKEKLKNLKRNLKGLLNRLAEENMAGICSQIENFYNNNSKNDMNDMITELLFDSLIMQTLTPERLVQEHALMVAVLSSNVGIEVSFDINCLYNYCRFCIDIINVFTSMTNDITNIFCLFF